MRLAKELYLDEKPLVPRQQVHRRALAATSHDGRLHAAESFSAR